MRLRRDKRENIGKPSNLIQQRRRPQLSGVRVSVQPAIFFHPFLSSFTVIYPLLNNTLLNIALHKHHCINQINGRKPKYIYLCAFYFFNKYKTKWNNTKVRTIDMWI